MIAKTGVGDIYYSFSHVQRKKPFFVGGGPRMAKAFTTCTMRVGQQMWAASSYCSVLDNFDHEKGRKLALARVMDKFFLPKKLRAEVWAHYLNRPRVNQQKKEQVGA